MVAGVFLGNYGRRIGLSERSKEALDIVWEFVAFLLTALVFLLIGLAITVSELVDTLPYIAWGVGGILVGRAVVIYALLGGASRLRHRRLGGAIPVSWLHVMFWGGLRGAVAMAMALSLPADFPQRVLLQEITFGIVLHPARAGDDGRARRRSHWGGHRRGARAAVGRRGRAEIFGEGAAGAPGGT